MLNNEEKEERNVSPLENKWREVLSLPRAQMKEELKKLNFSETTPEGRNILHIACEQYINKGLIDEILDINYRKQTLNLNLLDKVKSWSPLFYIIDSCDNGQPDIVELLVKNGCDLKISDNKGITPLHLACYHGQDDNIEYLIKSNADLNAKDIKGRTPLTYAIIEGQTNCVQFLLEKNSDISVIDCQGNSLLHYAVNCKGNSLLYSNMLIKKGANVNVKNCFGNTPIMDLIINNIAKENVRLIMLLKQSGAIVDGIYNKQGQSFYSLLGEEADMFNFKYKKDYNKNIDNTKFLGVKNIALIIILSVIVLVISHLISPKKV